MDPGFGQPQNSNKSPDTVPVPLTDVVDVLDRKETIIHTHPWTFLHLIVHHVKNIRSSSLIGL